jgi:hypothetical protein
MNFFSEQMKKVAGIAIGTGRFVLLLTCNAFKFKLIIYSLI